MTYLDIIKKVVKSTGRYELVTGSYKDNGIGFYINAAQRFLDSHRPTSVADEVKIVGLSAGDSTALIEGCRVIKNVQISNIDGMTQLHFKSISWIRRHYNMIDSVVVSSSTTTLSSGLTVSATDVNVGVADGTIASGGYVIRIGSELMYVKSVNGNTWNVYRGSNGTTIAAHNSGDTVYVVGRGIILGRPKYFAINVIQTAPSHIEDTLSSFANSWGLNDIYFGANYNYKGIKFMPACEESFNLAVEGSYFSQELSDSDDVSYWTEVNPAMLVTASSVFLEADLRNTEGLRDHMVMLDRLIQNLNIDATEQEIQYVKGFED